MRAPALPNHPPVRILKGLVASEAQILAVRSADADATSQP